MTLFFLNEGVILVLKYSSHIFALLYGFFALVLIVALWKSKKMNQKIGIIFLIVSAFSGFFVFPAVLPYQFQTLLLRNLSAHGGPVYVIIAGLLFFLVMSFLFGRVFCANICPVGVLQEIISLVPVGKKGKTAKKYSVPFRAAVFVVFLVSGVFFSVNLLRLFGVRDFFNLNFMSISFFIFLAFLIASFFVYRPFCRFICPYGVLLSLVSRFGVYKFRRTDKCIDCGKCEKVCPVNEALMDSDKSECYMCGRCMDVCPVEGALEYLKKQVK